MEGIDFEYYCADLLTAHGFNEVEVTKSSGDYGIDILAQKEGITYAIQCKRYSGPVGVKAVQEAYAGRDYYDCMVGCVLTNQYFTQPAVDAAKKLKSMISNKVDVIRDGVLSIEEVENIVPGDILKLSSTISIALGFVGSLLIYPFFSKDSKCEWTEEVDFN